MQDFQGNYIKFIDSNLSFTGESSDAKFGLEELKVFKKIAQLEKRQINETLRLMRDENKDRMIARGPASQGSIALLGRGTKLGAFARSVGAISRTAQRQADNQRLAPLEDKKAVIENVLVAASKMEIALKKEILMPGSVIGKTEDIAPAETKVEPKALTQEESISEFLKNPPQEMRYKKAFDYQAALGEVIGWGLVVSPFVAVGYWIFG